MSWVDKLIQEYKDGRESLKRVYKSLNKDQYDDVEKIVINSMIADMTYVIKWLETGRDPDSYRGIDKRNVYRLSYYEDMEIIPDINKELNKEREPLYMSQKQRKALINLFKRFSNRERQCFIMYEAEQLSMQQIADKLGISKSTVQSYINRAREKVKEIAS